MSDFRKRVETHIKGRLDLLKSVQALDERASTVLFARTNELDQIVKVMQAFPKVSEECNFIQATICADRWPHDQTQWCGRCLLRSLMRRGGSPTEPTEQPDDRYGRFILNGYGRYCYNLGWENAKANP